MRVKIVKRIMFLGIFISEEVFFDGNIWIVSIKNVDRLSLLLKVVRWSWYLLRGYGIIWIVVVDIIVLKGYSIK